MAKSNVAAIMRRLDAEARQRASQARQQAHNDRLYYAELAREERDRVIRENSFRRVMGLVGTVAGAMDRTTAQALLPVHEKPHPSDAGLQELATNFPTKDQTPIKHRVKQIKVYRWKP